MLLAIMYIYYILLFVHCKPTSAVHQYLGKAIAIPTREGAAQLKNNSNVSTRYLLIRISRMLSSSSNENSDKKMRHAHGTHTQISALQHFTRNTEWPNEIASPSFKMTNRNGSICLSFSSVPWLIADTEKLPLCGSIKI